MLLLALVLCVGCSESSSPKRDRAGAPLTFRPRFGAGNFRGTNVDNPWYPLKPGTTFVYRGTKDNQPARDVVTVRRGTKEILGVRTTVVHDRLFLGGELAEETMDWYAQDEAGNVWYLGEATKELEHGKVKSTEGSWQAGAEGARPGVIMQADPGIGDAYEQEHFEGQAEDRARVLSLSASVAVPIGSWSTAQLTREWTPLEPDVIDHKYYVRGVGLVKEVTAKGPLERLVLVRVTGR